MRRLIGVALTAALVIAACTSDDETSDESSEITSDDSTSSDESNGTSDGVADEEAPEPTEVPDSNADQPGIGSEWEVAYDEAAAWLEALPAEEQQEQVRDWAQHGLATILNLSTEEATGFFHDRPGVREAVLTDVVTEARGPGRHLYDDGTLHVLIDATDPYRSRTIGMAIDDFYLDRGDVPADVAIYVAEDQPEAQSVSIELVERAPLETMEEAHGFVRQTVESSDDVVQFLSDTEHFSGAAFDGGSLILYGWDWPDRDGAGVTPEDLAVLQRGYGPSSAAGAPGFSLDPIVDQVDEIDLLVALLPEAEPWVIGDVFLASALGLTDAELAEVAAEIGYTFEDAIFYGEAAQNHINEAMFGGEAELAAAAEYFAIEPDRTKFYALQNFMEGLGVASIARYDGGIEGTEVGMTLFYTDLIAKDWTQGIGSGVPSDSGIDDFATATNLGTNWSHCPSSDETGRLWFGLDSGAAVTTDDEIALGSVATRLFARSDAEVATSGGAEVENSYHFGEPLRWWDRHYLEVADYEPQYQRLDQLMRWSAALAWLTDNGVELPVQQFEPTVQSLRYDEWAASNPELREQAEPYVIDLGPEINEIVAPVPSVPFEECGGEFVSGGVTLTGRPALAKLIAVGDDVPAPYRRANLIASETDFAVAGRLSAGTVDDFATVVNPVNRRVVTTPTGTRVEVEAFQRQVTQLGGVNATGLTGQPRLFTFENSFEPGYRSTAIAVGDDAMGTLEVQAIATGATIRWKSGIIDKIREIGNRLQMKLTSSDAPTNDPLALLDDVDEVTLVVTEGSRSSLQIIDGSWLRLSDEVLDDATVIKVGIPTDDAATGRSLYLGTLDDAPPVDSATLQFVERTGRKRINIGGQTASPPQAVAVGDLDQFAAGRPIYTRIADDGQLAAEGLDPGIRVVVREADLAASSLPDVQVVDGVSYASTSAPSISPATGTSIVLVEECSADQEVCKS